MRSAVSDLVGRLNSLVSPRTGRVPTGPQLVSHAMRHVAAAALVLLAAGIVHGSGHADQQWQYVAMAAALAPQVLVDALAAQDLDRRTRLQTSARPSVVPLLAACALLVAAPTSFAATGAAAPALAALCAAIGLAVAAAPTSVLARSRR